MVANVGMELLASGALVLLYIGLTLPAVRTLTGSLLGPDLLLRGAVARPAANGPPAARA